VARTYVQDGPGLLDLAARLAGEVRRFVDQRLELFKAEIKEEAAHTVKGFGLLAGGAVAASVGVVLLLVAAGLWVGDLVGSTSGGLAIVGGALAVVGGGLALLAMRSLKRRRLVRDTVDDLRRDAEWIRHGV
jgi:uncharacterized membrane protein YqjE